MYLRHFLQLEGCKKAKTERFSEKSRYYISVATKTERSVSVYREIIQDSIDYIEENIKCDISAAELSEKAGFSLFHYYRLFQTAVGMPVREHIKEIMKAIIMRQSMRLEE